jgi:hypothetical protein
LKNFITVLLTASSLLVLLLLNTQAFAQKYKIKDDIILKDNVPLGKVTGRSNLLNADFQIYTMSGEKILSIQRDEFVSTNPFYVERYWYNIHFNDTGKDMMLPMSVEFSKKSVLNKTLMEGGIVIDGTAIKNQDSIIAKNDITDSIAKDTIDAVRSLSEMKALIYSGTIQRNTAALIDLIVTENNTIGDSTIIRWTIIQDGKEVGAIVRRIVKNIYGKDRIRYIIYKKVPGESIVEVPVALVREFIDYGSYDSPDVHIIKCFTVVDNVKHDVNLGTVYATSWTVFPANALVKYLISKKYF